MPEPCGATAHGVLPGVLLLLGESSALKLEAARVLGARALDWFVVDMAVV